MVRNPAAAGQRNRRRPAAWVIEHLPRARRQYRASLQDDGTTRSRPSAAPPCACLPSAVLPPPPPSAAPRCAGHSPSAPGSLTGTHPVLLRMCMLTAPPCLQFSAYRFSNGFNTNFNATTGPTSVGVINTNGVYPRLQGLRITTPAGFGTVNNSALLADTGTPCGLVSSPRQHRLRASVFRHSPLAMTRAPRLPGEYPAPPKRCPNAAGFRRAPAVVWR